MPFSAFKKVNFLTAFTAAYRHHLHVAAYWRINLGNIHRDLLHNKDFFQGSIKDSFGDSFQKFGSYSHFFFHDPVEVHIINSVLQSICLGRKRQISPYLEVNPVIASYLPFFVKAAVIGENPDIF